MLKRFEIVDCCGRHCEYIEYDIPEGTDWDSFTEDIIAEAGYHNHQCESCYSNAYGVRES